MTGAERANVVGAFVNGAVHKYATEEAAIVRRGAGYVALEHQRVLNHPWPREFEYRWELFVTSSDPVDALQRAHTAFGGAVPEHTVNLLGAPATACDRVIEVLGYERAWQNVVMARRLRHADAEAISDQVRPMQTSEDVEAANAFGPDNPVSELALSDPALCDFVAEVDGKVAAKAQLVLLPDTPAYVSDMYTAEAQRRRGAGTALMNALHASAQSFGSSTAVLVPSRMARDAGFYEAFGYVPVTTLDLLIPAGAPD